MEYKIVAFLARNSGKVMTYSAIRSNIWGPYADNNRILRVNMANIRRKLEKNPAQPEYIYTEVGVGYRMREDDSKQINGTRKWGRGIFKNPPSPLRVKN